MMYFLADPHSKIFMFISGIVMSALSLCCYPAYSQMANTTNTDQNTRWEKEFLDASLKGHTVKVRGLMARRGASISESYDYSISSSYLQHVLGTFPHDTHILYYDHDGTFLRMWLIGKDGIISQDKLEISHQDISKRINRLKMALNLGSRQKERAPMNRGQPIFAGDAASQKNQLKLGDEVISVTEMVLPTTIGNKLSKAKKLIIIPCLDIGAIPFAILKPLKSDSALIDMVSYMIAPSANDIRPCEKKDSVDIVYLDLMSAIVGSSAKGATPFNLTHWDTKEVEIELTLWSRAKTKSTTEYGRIGDLLMQKEGRYYASSTKTLVIPKNHFLTATVINKSDRDLHIELFYFSAGGEYFPLLIKGLKRLPAKGQINADSSIFTDTSGHESLVLLVSDESTDLLSDEMLSSLKSTAMRKSCAWKPMFRNPLLVGNPAYGNSGDWFFPQLPGAEDEVRNISAFLGAKPLLGKDATLDAIYRQMKGTDLLYFATHGVANAVNPMEQSFLALANNGGESFLTARMIQNFPGGLDAEVVILSACQTGLGMSHDAGIIGLARAFYLAKVPYVVMSLWNVDDAATASLMSSFMRHVKNQVPPDALRKAMLEYRSVNSDPSAWASFVVLGTMP
ncbi:MAG: CHAT domain-containing protein [Syntrophus sp. (in: bacteria)]